MKFYVHRDPNNKLQMIPYMNSQENAREILKNLGTNIDVVGGIFDETMLALRQCAGLELSHIYHPGRLREKLGVVPLAGSPQADAA